MDETKKEVGKRIAEIRKSKGLKQEEFKELIGAPTIQMISGWENGHSFPSANYLIIMAKKLDISLDYILLGGKNDPDDKTIRTYKEAFSYIVELLKSKLFKIEGYPDLSSGKYITMLSSSDDKVNEFKKEYIILSAAAKTIRDELMQQAFTDLLNKYDIPLKG